LQELEEMKRNAAASKAATLIDMVLDNDGVARRILSIDDLIDGEIVRSLLGMSIRAFRRLGDAGPSCIVIDARVFYRLSEVTAWLAARKKSQRQPRHNRHRVPRRGDKPKLPDPCYNNIYWSVEDDEVES
jgi:hypothetical protein